jgi:hypothetical protein
MGGLNLVGELYDYMIGIVVVGVIFTSAVFAIPAISYVNLLQVDQQQLRNTALNVFNTMLLGTGSPSDWGSTYPFDQNNVEAFGLDLSDEPSLYILDTDKMQRLDQDSPGLIEYPYVRDLLRLKDYGFSLTLFRPFTVEHNLEILDEETVWFAVNVTRNEDGRPIPNAQVSVTILVTGKKVAEQSEDPIVIVTQPNTYFTDCLGRCEGNESIVLPPGCEIETAMAVMEITVAGTSTTVVALENSWAKEVMKINTFGDTVTLSIRNDTFSKMSTRKILNVFAYDFDELTKICEDPEEDKITHGLGWVSLEFTFPGIKAMDPALLLFTVSVSLGNETGGRRPVIVVGPFSFWEPSMVFSFGPYSEQFIGTAVKLRRYVVIAGMTYIAELTLWKE